MQLIEVKRRGGLALTDTDPLDQRAAGRGCAVFNEDELPILSQTVELPRPNAR
jgi:hypothetical protein